MLIELYDPKTGIIALKNRFPRCPRCDSERDYSERKFISLYGQCEPCYERNVPTIIRRRRAEMGRPGDSGNLTSHF